MSTPVSESEKLAAAAREHGALPVPVGGPTFTGCLPLAEALLDMARMYADVLLPAPAVFFFPDQRDLTLSVSSPDAFERWRTALQIAPDTVELLADAGRAWLAASGVFHGVRVRLTGHGLALSQEQAAPPPPPPVSAGGLEGRAGAGEGAAL